MKNFPIYRQLDSMDCGPVCLKMIAQYHGIGISLNSLRKKTNINREGVSLLDLSRAAETIGFKSIAKKITFETLLKRTLSPCILHWNSNHFVVLYGVKKNKMLIADPAEGRLELNEEEFLKHWHNENGSGVVLYLESTSKAFESNDKEDKKITFKRLFEYLVLYKKLFVQLFIGLLVGSILQLLFPFLTQAIVDIGINTRNLDFIFLILIAQIILFLGRISVDFFRGWILLYISTRVNIKVVSDFLFKLVQLPVSFFESRKTGDILQRIGDQNRIESFLTGTSLTTLFSLLNFIVFSVVIIIYNINIFFVFCLGSILYTLWVTLFLRHRRKLDYKVFEYSSRNQSKIIQLVAGITEIKINNCERSKRWEWEEIQANLFQLSIKTLSINQYQQVGAFILNEGKNIFITYISAKAVINGEMTLGAMLSIQYIIGQLNSPIEQLVQFLRSYQDAKISLERLNEIYEHESEEPFQNNLTTSLPSNHSIQFKDVSFSYSSSQPAVLRNLNIRIPEKKITAIVGTSGSGKTTLLKLLLKFYDSQNGEILIGESDLKNISHSYWRSNIGVVLQDGYIFSDTIKNNIALSDDLINEERLLHAATVANILEFIESTPQGFNTIIGQEGIGISQGQKQRILIARAVYKNPKYVLFDEATNALDANNEKIIMNRLNDFFRERTVIVVAHRLSTVKNADQILVVDKGEVIEHGTHTELVNLRGGYYELVKNQLELGT